MIHMWRNVRVIDVIHFWWDVRVIGDYTLVVGS
jgi:hypothetical protein